MSCRAIFFFEEAHIRKKFIFFEPHYMYINDIQDVPVKVHTMDRIAIEFEGWWSVINAPCATGSLKNLASKVPIFNQRYYYCFRF